MHRIKIADVVLGAKCCIYNHGETYTQGKYSNELIEIIDLAHTEIKSCRIVIGYSTENKHSLEERASRSPAMPFVHHCAPTISGHNLRRILNAAHSLR